MLTIQFLEDGAAEKEESPTDDTMEDADDLVCTCTDIYFFMMSFFQFKNKNGVIIMQVNQQSK